MYNERWKVIFSIFFLCKLHSSITTFQPPISQTLNDPGPVKLSPSTVTVQFQLQFFSLHANRWRKANLFGELLYCTGLLHCQVVLVVGGNCVQLEETRANWFLWLTMDVLSKPILHSSFAVFAVLRHQLLVFLTTSMKNASYEGQLSSGYQHPREW
jgi:hypothetical protein